MRTFSLLTVLLGAVSLSACVSASSPPSFEQEYTKYEPLAEDVATIAGSQGNTLYASLPSGTGKYTGLLLGNDLCYSGNDPDNCDGPAVDFIAKLVLNVNFDSQDMPVTGTLSEFVTKLANFKNPSGVIEVTGQVFEQYLANTNTDQGPGNYSYIHFEGKDQLTSGNNVAVFWFKTGSPSGADLGADGALGGNAGQVMAGDFGSDFEWLAGVYAGKLSGTDGEWVVIVQ